MRRDENKVWTRKLIKDVKKSQAGRSKLLSHTRQCEEEIKKNNGYIQMCCQN